MRRTGLFVRARGDKELLGSILSIVVRVKGWAFSPFVVSCWELWTGSWTQCYQTGTCSNIGDKLQPQTGPTQRDQSDK